MSKYSPQAVLTSVAPIVTLDIGARNGPTDTKRIASVSSVYCFEPNLVEFKKLQGQNSLKGPPKCGELRCFPAAVCGYSGTATLNISRRPGATSTLEPNREVLEAFAADNWSELMDITDRIQVPAVTLAGFAESEGLTHIDFLKLDTQGNELDILKSAGSLLDRIGVIKTEVEFIEMYKGQPMFDEVAGFLRNLGFELIDIETSPACRRFHRFDKLRPSAYRLVWGDLIFVRRPFDKDDPRALAKAAVIAAMGYADLASQIVRTVYSRDETLCDAFDGMALEMLRPGTTAGRIRLLVERLFGVLMMRYDWRCGHQVNSLR